MNPRIHPPARTHRGFTLVEVIVAGVIMALLLAAIAVATGQITRARNLSRDRMEAFARADVALQAIRSDLATVLRRQDLFQTWVLIRDDTSKIDDIQLDRDRVTIFNNHLRAVRTIDYNGEGIEYESGWQILEDPDGPVLWQRRDALPDSYPRAGGVASPRVEGILELSIEAWDGEQWLEEWDSDIDGLPYGFRVSVTATGARPGEDRPLDAPLATLRTVVPVDRAWEPMDKLDWALAEEIAINRNLPPEQVEGLAEAIENGTPLPLTATPVEGGADEVTGAPAATGGGRTVTGIPEGLPVPTRPSRPAGGGGGR